MGDNESANQITMSYVDPPQIMVLDPHTQHYFWPPFSMDHANIQAVVEFLDSIINGTATVKCFIKKIAGVGAACLPLVLTPSETSGKHSQNTMPPFFGLFEF